MSKTPVDIGGPVSPLSKMVYRTAASSVAALVATGDPNKWLTISHPRNYGAANQVKNRIRMGRIVSWQQFVGKVDVRTVPADTKFEYLVQIRQTDGADLAGEFDWTGIDTEPAQPLQPTPAGGASDNDTTDANNTTQQEDTTN